MSAESPTKNGEMTSLSWDFLLDGFVIDALVQVDIVDCQAEMERLYEQTETICKSLRQRAESIRQQKEVLQKQWLEYMETIG